MTGWCILRTAPSRTIPLCTALSEAGFEAWTPTEVTTVRNARTRKREERRLPITPSFVFSPFERLADLRRLVQSPQQTYQVWDSEQGRMVMRGIPYFALFRSGGKFPMVSDRALAPLRSIERTLAPRISPTTFRLGQQVRLADGGLEGLTGTVEGSRGRFVLVAFSNFPVSVQVDPRYLQPFCQAL